MAGGLLPAALLWATDRSERWRKPAAVGMVLLFPLWAALGVLSLSVPMLELFLGLSVDFEPGAGSFVRGTVTVGMILGSMRLFGLADRRDR